MFTPETYLPPPTAYTPTPTNKMRTYTITGFVEEINDTFTPYKEQVVADDFKSQLSEGRATFFIEGKAVAYFEGVERITYTPLE
jgi:hypothetical protein